MTKYRFLTYTIAILCFLHVGSAYSQDTLWYDDFMQMVKSNHPDAINANLIQEQADLQLRAARGAFDPELVSKYKEKYFQDKFYYLSLIHI